VGKRWGGDSSRAADLNQPKGYSTPYDVTLSNKRWGRGKKGQALIMKTSVFANNLYTY